MEKLILIDGSGLIYRSFYAVPPFMRSPAGVQTNAVFGFANILLSIISTQKPDFLAVAWDKRGPTFRHEAFAEYKATRTAAPDELYAQIPLVKELVKTFTIPTFEAAGFEADDIIATIAALTKSQKNLELLVATGDFDIFQVVRDDVKILYPTKGFKAAEIFGTSDIVKKYGIHPEQIPDYKGIAGDASDNIPGVHGIGDKGAISLLTEFGSLENVYENLPKVREVLRKKLEASREQAFMSKELATLRLDVPVDFDLEACRVKNFSTRNVREAFAAFGFKSLLKRVDEVWGEEAAVQTQGSLFG